MQVFKKYILRPYSLLIACYKRIKREYYTQKIRRSCCSYGAELRVNRKSRVSSLTTLVNNVNFNGMLIAGGGGKVTIGDNFHSEIECMMITQFHNYEGEKIPYDNTYIFKDITIEDNVW